MLSKLGDKYTRYLTPPQYTALMNSATGELTGVGIELLGKDDGSVIVNNLEDDSPAKDSGIQRGDIIVNIDGTPTKGLSPEEVAALAR
jgi:carboxyl-terminal processing protease